MTALGSNFYFPPSRLNYLVQLRSLLTQGKLVAIEGGIGIGKTVLLEEVLTTSMPEANKCYVTAAKNITDVQLRSRVIEQLFGNVLFDPEKPLVASFLEFNQQTELMIAIDNGHYLSAKIIGELLQVFSQLNGAGIQLAIVMSFDRTISSTLLNIKSQIIAVETVPKLSKDESYQLLSTYFSELPTASDGKVKRWIENAKGVPIQLLAYDENNNFEVKNAGLNLKVWGTVVVLASLLLTTLVYAYNMGWLSSPAEVALAPEEDEMIEQVVNANKTQLPQPIVLDTALAKSMKSAAVATAADIFEVLEVEQPLDMVASGNAVVEKEIAPSDATAPQPAIDGQLANSVLDEDSEANQGNSLRVKAEPPQVPKTNTTTTEVNDSQAQTSEQVQQAQIIATTSEQYPETIPTSWYQIDNDQFLSLPADHYVLQFTAVSTEATLAEYLQSVKVNVDDFRIYQIKRNGTDWIVVTYGLYDSITAARRDAQKLEPNAWAKSVAVIQQQIRAYQQSFEKSE